MIRPDPRRWLRPLLLAAAVYLLAGVGFGALAGAAGSHQMVVAWRLAAWAVSAITFGWHIGYQQLRLGSSPATTALRAASAAALGAFGLAVAANVHRWMIASTEHTVALTLSLAAWPVVTAVPAFLVALVAALVLARLGRNKHPVN